MLKKINKDNKSLISMVSRLGVETAHRNPWVGPVGGGSNVYQSTKFSIFYFIFTVRGQSVWTL